MIGLMGIDGKGTMYTPNGKKLFKLPMSVAWRIQRIQHWVAQKTWR